MTDFKATIAEGPPQAVLDRPDCGSTDFLGSRQGRALQREIVRGVFRMMRKRL